MPWAVGIGEEASRSKRPVAEESERSEEEKEAEGERGEEVETEKRRQSLGMFIRQREETKTAGLQRAVPRVRSAALHARPRRALSHCSLATAAAAAAASAG